MKKYIQPWTRFIAVNMLLLLLVACTGSSTRKEPEKIDATVIPEVAVSQPQISADTQNYIKEVDKNRFQQALDLIKKAEYETAENDLSELLKLYPKVVGIYINLGIIKTKKSEWQAAETLLLQAKNLSPENVFIANYLGIVYRQQGRFVEAEAAYKQAIKLDENYAQAYLNLGILYDLYLSNFQAARQYYEKFSLLSPENKKIKDWLADLEQRERAAKQ